ncbi:MAG: DUF4012 domain-containing protein [Actinomycetota bacterium]
MLVGGLITLAILTILSLLAVLPALSAARLMQQGRDALTAGRSLMAEGKVEEAGASFVNARTAFDAAAGKAGNPALRILGLVPFAGNTADALLGLARSGVHVSQAGVDLTTGVGELPRGLDSLAPEKGRVPIEALQRLQPALVRARAQVDEATTIAGDLPRTFLLGPVDGAVDGLRDGLRTAAPAIRSVEAMVGAFPEFAGAGGTRRYLVVAQNPAELRATGGFAGEIAVLTIRDGRMSLSPFRSTNELPAQPDNPKPKGVPTFFGLDMTRYPVDSNLLPQLPEAATFLERLYEQATGTRLDGAVYVDPQAVSAMLRATGPLKTRDLGTLTAENVVPLTTNRVYTTFEPEESEARKESLGAAAHDVWRALLTRTPPDAALGALIEAGGDGHLLLHSTDPVVEASFVEAGVAGSFGPPGADWDFFSAPVNNWSRNKIDFYLDTDIAYDITLQPDGSAIAEATATYTNDAPKGAKPSYALGPYPYDNFEHLRAGDAYQQVGFYCVLGCRLEAFTSAGEPESVQAERDGDLQLYGVYERLAPQSTGELAATLTLPDAWDGDFGGGTYRLRLQGQPTIRPTTGTVIVRAPAGMHFAESDDPDVRIDGDIATWTGEVGKWKDLGLELERGFFGKVWGFLNRPAFSAAAV